MSEGSMVAARPSRGLTRWLAPAGLLIVSVLGIGAVFWGQFVAHPGIRVFEFDAGPVDGLEIGLVRPFPDLGLYLVGLADGRVRAIDARVHSTGCTVAFLPDDERGRSVNPRGLPGVYEDACTGAYWAVDGDQIGAASRPPEPLRTFELAYKTLPDGKQHIFVEVIGREQPSPAR
jgi:hypothetical protein